MATCNTILAQENCHVLHARQREGIESHQFLSDGSGRVEIWGFPDCSLVSADEDCVRLVIRNYAWPCNSLLDIILDRDGFSSEIPDNNTAGASIYKIAKHDKRIRRIEQRIQGLYVDNMCDFPSLCELSALALPPREYGAQVIWDNWVISMWSSLYVISDANGSIIAALGSPKYDLQLGDSSVWCLTVGEYVIIINNGDVSSVVVFRRPVADDPSPLAYCVDTFTKDEDNNNLVKPSSFCENISGNWNIKASSGTLTADEILTVYDEINTGDRELLLLITDTDPHIDSLKDIMWVVPGLCGLKQGGITTLESIENDIRGEVHRWGAYWILTIDIIG